MNLILHLKKEYFDQIKSGAKAEEYRLTTPYWQRRLEDRDYEKIILLCGYPKRGDISRQIVRPWRGVERKTIMHPHFGDHPVEVFAINLAIKCFGPMVGGPCAWTVRRNNAPDEAQSESFTLAEERRPSERFRQVR